MITSKKFQAFISTATFGFYKLLILFLVERNYNMNEVGILGVYMSVSQIISLISVSGFCTLILSRVAHHSTEQKKLEVFNKILLMIFCLLILIAFLLLILFLIFNKFFYIEIIIWLSGFTIYLSSKHYFIANKLYIKIIAVDLFLILISFFFITNATFENISVLLAIVLNISGIIGFFLIKNFKLFNLEEFSFDRKGIEFGVSQLIRNGMILSIIPLSSYFLNYEYAGVFALYISIINIFSLLPRTVSIFYFPDLAKDLKNKINLKKLTQKLNIKLLLLGIFQFIASIIIINIFSNYYNLTNINFIISLFFISFFYIVSNLSLIDSNILMIKELSKINIIINLILLFIFVTSILIISYMNFENQMLLLCVVLSVLSCIRYIFLKKVIN